MTESATVNIPKDVLQPIIQARVNAALVECFQDKQWLLDQMVERIVTTRVDNDGRPSNNHYHTTTLIEFETNRAVQAATRAAITEACELHKDRIKAALTAQLQRRNSPLMKQLVETLVTGLTGAVKSEYRLSIEYVEPKR